MRMTVIGSDNYNILKYHLLGVVHLSNYELIGKCGLYCGACTIYIAQRDNVSFRNKLASNFNCLPEQVKCNGCGSLSSECWGNGCDIVKCINTKGYKFCYECDEYFNNSCKKFDSLANRYFENSNVDLRSNLKMIEAGEIETWLEKSKSRFTCNSCKNPIVSGAKKCHHCNCDII